MSRRTRTAFLLVAVAVLAASTLLAAPPARRIVDINRDPEGVSIQMGTAAPHGAFFTAYRSSPDPNPLWWTDGTAEGTRALGDVGMASGVELDGVAVFEGWTLSGRDFELWRSDGTLEGTERVADIWPGQTASDPYSFVRVDGKAFFAAADQDHGRELWVTDGTAAGTRLVLDIWVGAASSSANPIIAWGSTLYFVADDGVHGYELWKTDGTAEGTRMVRDVFPGPEGSNPYPGPVFHNTLVFSADDGVHGYEPWVTDGTTDGTRMILDIMPGPESSYGLPIVPYRDKLIFSAADVEHGWELWSSDLTAAGTSLMLDLVPGPESASAFPLVGLGDVLLFTLYDGSTGREILWRLDPSLPAPEPFAIQPVDIYFSSSPLSLHGDTIYYAADDGVHGAELWRSDGSRDGTRILADINPGPEGSIEDYYTYRSSLAFLGDSVLLGANDGVHGSELMSVNRTTGVSRLVRDFFPGTAGSIVRGFGAFDGRALFEANDHRDSRRLWSTDGTADGTRRVPLPVTGAPWDYLTYQDRLLFTIGGSGSDQGLWSWDGETEEATRLGDYGEELTPWNGEIWYRGQHPTFGSQMFRTDGTPGGTGLAFVVNGRWDGSEPRGLHPAGDLMYFSAWGQDGEEPHVTNGSSVWEFDLWPNGHSCPGGFRSVPESSTVWFNARTPAEGGELWRFEGAFYPHLVKDIWPGPNSSYPFVVHLWADDRALVVASDFDHGRELWVSDGTDEGTVLLRDLNPGRPSGVSPWSGAAEHDGIVYFTGDDGIHGRELWRTDGTPDGTSLVADLFPGPEGSSPAGFGIVDGHLFFSARDDAHGAELWISDGTGPGTRLFQDLRPGPGSSGVGGLTAIGDRVYFEAFDDEAGYEPWSFRRCRLPGADTLPPVGAITAPTAGTCFGPSAVPVVVADSFADRCDEEIVRTYTPAGGPSYSTHGDLVVDVLAADSAGNTAAATRAFTIDLVPPVVNFTSRPRLPRPLPSSIPFSLVWKATDADGASGGVTNERVFIDDCLLWDGATYGDGDGLLSDETLFLGRDELCRLARTCGQVKLQNPKVRVEASDCGGNSGSATARLTGAFRIPSKLCGG